MNETFLIAQLMMLIIIGVAIRLLVEFVRSKNGTLRKIMIAYFSVEIFMYTGWVIFLCLAGRHNDLIYTIILSLPKAVIKIRLLKWIQTGK